MKLYHGEEIQEVIKRRAYNKYLIRTRCNVQGCAEDDWREAEKEVREEINRMDTRKFE
jgi:hypothetical protein